MIGSKKVCAIILARGGSKRIPRKNIKILAGKPLIVWTIEEAKKSTYIDRIILSTDDKEIADLAKSMGVEVPFTRPDEFANDTATDYSTFVHAIGWLKDNEQYVPDMIIHLRPTSPLRTVEHIDKAVELLANNPEADSVRTVTEPEQSPYKMYTINGEGYIEPLLKIEGKESMNMASQALQKVYKHVGYVDVFWTKTVTEQKVLSGKLIKPYILDMAWNGINVLSDWDMYEFLMKKMKRV